MALGQRIDFFAGGNRNRYFTQEDYHDIKTNPENGFSFGLGIDSIVSGILHTRFVLQIDNYGGGMEIAQHHVSMSDEIKFNSRKTVLNLCYFPLNIRRDKFDFSMGISYGILLKGKTTANEHGWNMTQNSYNLNFEEKKGFNSENNLGFLIRTAYDFYLSKTLSVTPQYICYISFTEDIAINKGYMSYYAKAYRNSLTVQLRKKIKIKEVIRKLKF